MHLQNNFTSIFYVNNFFFSITVGIETYAILLLKKCTEWGKSKRIILHFCLLWRWTCFSIIVVDAKFFCLDVQLRVQSFYKTERSFLRIKLRIEPANHSSLATWGYDEWRNYDDDFCRIYSETQNSYKMFSLSYVV